MKMLSLSCSLILIIGLTKCGKLQEKEVKSGALETSTADFLVSELATKQLIETVLNLPDVIRFCKVDLIQKKYGAAAIYFEQDSIARDISSIFQNGNSLRLVQSMDTIDSEEEPCYVFSKIVIDNNDAYVYMTFDITGAIAYGNLKWIDGQWLPTQEFLVGVR